MSVVLRDYQQDIYDRTRQVLRKGYKNPLLVLPCRSGKSYVMKAITESANEKGNHVLILAHRNSLINQHKELFEDIDWNLTRIESVFTEVRHLGEKGPVDLIIIDEAHISGASSYQKVCDYYNCSRIGFTGSPVRLDGKPLNLFDIIVKGITAKELIQRGAVSDYHYYAPDLNLDLNKIKRNCGDYNNQELGQVMSSKRIYGDILKYYNMLAKDKQAIAYCVNIAHSQEVCEMFNTNGITSRHIDSHTPEKEREAVLKEFKEGKFKILCNCNLISEGITLPTAEVGLLLRPTLSLALYIQQSMRCLTPVKGKKAIIIDFVNNIQRHGPPAMDRDWSLEKPVKEYINENDDGTFKVRVCQNCFSTFETAPVCPYCGAAYETTPVEIQNFKEIELKEIEEEKERKRQVFLNNIKEKVKKYKSVYECQNWVELVKFAEVNGKKPRICVCYG